MLDNVNGIFGTLAIATVITALVLPGRQTPALVSNVLNGLANVERASYGS
jgi:hypothetical protein